ncbi:hypothetical protein RJ639_046120 [Escallonia herrerae]|uniref:Uncharacterized protein n=1 Tax=Escallonia herrerae TaxID=1293975 RepID=A0AA89B082_9ASTE|nr:hypothetical protein RJ639_046120 [Escallonia herrerae]
MGVKWLSSGNLYATQPRFRFRNHRRCLIVGVQELSADKVEQWIRSCDGFNLVIGASPCNNLAGGNRVKREEFFLEFLEKHKGSKGDSSSSNREAHIGEVEGKKLPRRRRARRNKACSTQWWTLPERLKKPLWIPGLSITS